MKFWVILIAVAATEIQSSHESPVPSGDAVKINGGEFKDFNGFKFRRSGDTTEIKGGEFHHFKDIKGRKKRETEVSRLVRCRINGGDFSGLSESEKQNLKSNCKVVGGDFGDKRSVRRVYEENLQDSDFKIEEGKYEGPGKGVGSLSDITGTKNHLIKNGTFSNFGNIKG